MQGRDRNLFLSGDCPLNEAAMSPGCLPPSHLGEEPRDKIPNLQQQVMKRTGSMAQGFHARAETASATAAANARLQKI